jgi:hypothetical protein
MATNAILGGTWQTCLASPEHCAIVNLIRYKLIWQRECDGSSHWASRRHVMMLEPNTFFSLFTLLYLPFWYALRQAQKATTWGKYRDRYSTIWVWQRSATGKAPGSLLQPWPVSRGIHCRGGIYPIERGCGKKSSNPETISL